ncbi:MAG: hypothetical protein WC684_04775 [Hyphomicrobium sp.]|jgi:hypothetical protein
MTKLLAAIAATFLAITAIASGAEAGFNVRINAPAGFSEVHKAGCGGGGGGYGRSYRRAAYQSVRRTKRRVEVASRKVSKPVVVAKAEPKVEPVEAAPEQTVAEVENSSISTDETVAVDKVAEVKVEKPVKKQIEQKVASAKDLGCKTFFASVGMTLSVPCAK